MIYEAVLFLVSAILLATLGLVAHKCITCQLAYWRFKKISNNLPIFHERDLIGNHTKWLLQKNFCQELAEQHKKLGKTFGWLLNDRYAASTVDLDLMKLFIHDEPNEHINRILNLGLPLKEIRDSLMLAGDNDWRKLRRHFAPALKSNKFKTPNVIGEIEMSISKLIDQIELELERSADAAGEGKKFEIDDLAHKYSLSLVFSCFYKQYNLIDFNDDDCYWTKIVDEGLRSIQTSMFIRISLIFPVLKRAIDWLGWHFTAHGKWRQSIMEFVKVQAKLSLEARRQGQELQKNAAPGEKVDLNNFSLKDGTKFKRNMIDSVIDHFLDGKLTRDEFFDNSSFLLSAAHKTAADAIVHTLYLLGRHQDVQEKLREAIMSDGMDAEYLAWVVNEALRLQPPAPIGCTRTITREVKLASGHVLPANTVIVTSSYGIHRLKEYWGEDADEFKPERWRDTSHFHPMQYIPFGAGIRGCPGKEFALFELKMLFSALLTRYKFECRHKDDMYTFASPFFVFLIPNSHTYITIKRLQ